MASIDLDDDVTTPVNSIPDSIPDELASRGTFLLQAVRPSTYQEKIPCYDRYQ